MLITGITNQFFVKNLELIAIIIKILTNFESHQRPLELRKYYTYYLFYNYNVNGTALKILYKALDYFIVFFGARFKGTVYVCMYVRVHALLVHRPLFPDLCLPIHKGTAKIF